MRGRLHAAVPFKQLVAEGLPWFKGSMLPAERIYGVPTTPCSPVLTYILVRINKKRAPKIGILVCRHKFNTSLMLNDCWPLCTQYDYLGPQL